MAKQYFQPEIETMPAEEIKKHQSACLVKQVQHVWDNVPYYRKKNGRCGSHASGYPWGRRSA